MTRETELKMLYSLKKDIWSTKMCSEKDILMRSYQECAIDELINNLKVKEHSAADECSCLARIFEFAIDKSGLNSYMFATMCDYMNFIYDTLVTEEIKYLFPTEEKEENDEG